MRTTTDTSTHQARPSLRNPPICSSTTAAATTTFKTKMEICFYCATTSAASDSVRRLEYSGEDHKAKPQAKPLDTVDPFVRGVKAGRELKKPDGGKPGSGGGGVASGSSDYTDPPNATAYSGNPDCSDFGYSFGMKMDGYAWSNMRTILNKMRSFTHYLSCFFLADVLMAMTPYSPPC